MPSLNTFTSVADIVITVAIFWVVLHNAMGRTFLASAALGIGIFEFSINLVAALIRLKEISVRTTFPRELEELARMHVALAVCSAVLWVILSIMAYRASRNGRHFFREMWGVTVAFAFLRLATFACGQYLTMQGA